MHHAMKTYEGVGALLLLISALDGDEWSGSRPYPVDKSGCQRLIPLQRIDT
jgi:hypothetical protein